MQIHYISFNQCMHIYFIITAPEKWQLTYKTNIITLDDCIQIRLTLAGILYLAQSMFVTILLMELTLGLHQIAMPTNPNDSRQNGYTLNLNMLTQLVGFNFVYQELKHCFHGVYTYNQNWYKCTIFHRDVEKYGWKYNQNVLVMLLIMWCSKL